MSSVEDHQSCAGSGFERNGDARGDGLRFVLGDAELAGAQSFGHLLGGGGLHGLHFGGREAKGRAEWPGDFDVLGGLVDGSLGEAGALRWLGWWRFGGAPRELYLVEGWNVDLKTPCGEPDDRGEESLADECGGPYVDQSRGRRDGGRGVGQVRNQVDLGVELAELVGGGAEIFVGELGVFFCTARSRVLPAPWRGVWRVKGRLFAYEGACREAEGDDREGRGCGGCESEWTRPCQAEAEGEEGPTEDHPWERAEEAGAGTECLFESHPE